MCDQPRFWWLGFLLQDRFYGYVSEQAICASVYVNNPRTPAATTAFVTSSRFVPASLPADRQKWRSESSEMLRQKETAFLKAGWHFGNRDSSALREVLVLFIYIQNEPMNVSSWVGYVHN